MNHRLPNRKHPVHGVELIPGVPTIVMVTVCTKARRAWLADDEIHLLLREIWQQATAWLVGRYVIMPDHIHLFAATTEETHSLESWVRYWKSLFSKRHAVADHRWQTDHWDRRMRNTRDFEETWEYVRWNPVRHRLVKKPEEWPYQGELFMVRLVN